MPRLARLALLVLPLLLLVRPGSAVDRHKFRTCEQTGFCRNYRPTTAERPRVGELLAGEVRATEPGVLSSGGVSLRCLASGAVRLRAVEPTPRWETSDILRDVSLGRWDASAPATWTCAGDVSTSRVRVSTAPWLQVELFGASDAHEPVLVWGQRGLSYFERTLAGSSAAAESGASSTTARALDAAGEAARKIVGWGEDGKPVYEGGEHDAERPEGGAEEPASKAPTSDRAAPETFGGFTDPKPRGPQSVGFDATFFGDAQLYGLPEHASNFSLRNTNGAGADAYSEPFRLFNLDVFEYELNEPMALYGAVPFVVARSASRGLVSGVLLNNPSETFVDVSTDERAPSRRHTMWMSESGVLDVFLFPGPTLAGVLDAYTRVTGRPMLPPLFATAYHQCRWNYRDERDVEEVHAKFEELDFPVDVICEWWCGGGGARCSD